jgi:hypothetical protein
MNAINPAFGHFQIEFLLCRHRFLRMIIILRSVLNHELPSLAISQLVELMEETRRGYDSLNFSWIYLQPQDQLLIENQVIACHVAYRIMDKVFQLKYALVFVLTFIG